MITELKQQEDNLKLESYIPILLMVIFTGVYFSTQYISIDYTTLFFGGVGGRLFAISISATSLYFWYEFHKTKTHQVKIALIGSIILLSAFNYYTVYKTQIKIASKKIETEKSLNDPFLLDLMQDIKAQKLEITDLSTSIQNKENSVLELQRQKKDSFKNIDDDYHLQTKKCRKRRKCITKAMRIRTNNKTRVSNSLKLQQNAFLAGISQLNNSLSQKENDLIKLKEKKSLRLDTLQEKQGSKLKKIQNDYQNKAFAFLIVFFSELSSFVFFRSFKIYRHLKYQLNHINQQKIINESSDNLEKLPLIDLKKKIEKKVQTGSFKFLGQRPLHNYARKRVIGKYSQGRAKSWIEEWEEKRWVIIERDSLGHWISIRYPPQISLIHDKMVGGFES